MSRQRRRVELVVDGRRELHRSTSEQPALVATAPPRTTWLAQAYDPAGHLLALLVANVPAGSRSPGPAPLVYTFATGAPAYLLQPDGLSAAMVNAEGPDGPVVAPIGAARASFPVYCATCRLEFELSAADLQRVRGSKPGKPGRLALGAPYSA